MMSREKTNSMSLQRVNLPLMKCLTKRGSFLGVLFCRFDYVDEPIGLEVREKLIGIYLKVLTKQSRY